MNLLFNPSLARKTFLSKWDAKVIAPHLSMQEGIKKYFLFRQKSVYVTDLVVIIYKKRDNFLETAR